MGEFETDMETRDAVEGLHNFQEFSQPPGECLDKAMKTRKKCSMGDSRKYPYLYHGRLFGFPKGRGGSRLWNSEGMGGIYDWKSEGMGGFHRWDF